MRKIIRRSGPSSPPMRELRKEQLSRVEEKKDSGLVRISPDKTHNRVTENRLYAILEDLEKYYELWLAYPDKLVDMLLPIDTTFKLFPFQKMMLRTNLRYKTTSFTGTRGASKSFIAVLMKMLKCSLLPRVKETIVAETKKQATGIARSKTQELFQLMPLLKEEVDFSRGSGTTVTDDYVRYRYKSGSELDVVYDGSATRGGRRHGLLADEIQNQPGESHNAVVLPLLNISRRMLTGELNPNEPHQQISYSGELILCP